MSDYYYLVLVLYRSLYLWMLMLLGMSCLFSPNYIFELLTYPVYQYN